MELQELLSTAREGMSNKVFGEPCERDGVTVVPVASVRGGAGGGAGPNGTQGSGGAYGLMARPVGAFVLKDGDVSWMPVVDVNRVVTGSQLFALASLLVVRSIVKTRIKRRR